MGKKKKKKKLGKELPEHFMARLKDIVGPSFFAKVEKTFIERPTTFRVNTIKAARTDVRDALVRQGFKIEQLPWYKDAFILRNKTKRDLTGTDIYKDGHIYIQSLASMIPPLVLDPKSDETILDLTAAPGSKTSQMAALMEQCGELVANDVNKVRFFRMKANMESLGVVDEEKDDWEFTLRLEDGSALTKEYDEYFDKILLDVVCSGESRFIDGQPKTYGYWSEHKIKRVAYRQQKLLNAASTVLKPGGVMVYSTCTIAPEENEMRITKFLDQHENFSLLKVSIDGVKAIPSVKVWKERKMHADISKTLRVLPTKDIEGFFIAILKKHV